MTILFIYGICCLSSRVVDEPAGSPKQMKIGHTFLIHVIRVYPRPILDRGKMYDYQNLDL